MLNKTKFEKVLKRIIDKNSNRCSMCKRVFTEPCHTFGGLDASNKVHNVGACCRGYIVDLRHAGVFTTAHVSTEEGQRQAKELLDTHPRTSRIVS